MRVQADLSRCLLCNVLRPFESLLRGYNDLQGAFEGPGAPGLGIGKAIGSLAACADAWRENSLFTENRSRRDEAPEERHVHAP